MKEIEDNAKYMNAIKNHPMYNTIITELDFNIKKKKWYIAYNPKYISVLDKTPGFDGTKTTLNDEEFIRALLLLKLSKEYQYHPAVSNIVLEKTYEAPGRPKKDVKGGRVDILLHDKEGLSSYTMN